MEQSHVPSPKVYVGNLSWNTTDETLRRVFSAYGNVADAIVMRDRDTGRSRGFGFVTFSVESEAEAAIAQLNLTDLDGRQIRVNFANAKVTSQPQYVQPMMDMQYQHPQQSQPYYGAPSYGAFNASQPQGEGNNPAYGNNPAGGYYVGGQSYGHYGQPYM